jgi:hypothetical protein
MKKASKSAQIRELAMKHPELVKLGPSAFARRVGVSRQCARGVLSRFLSDHSEEDLQSFQQHRLEAWDAIGMRSLESVTPAKLVKASAASLVMIAGVAEDKRRLIMGLPTGFNVNVILDLMAIVRGDKKE